MGDLPKCVGCDSGVPVHQGRHTEETQHTGQVVSYQCNRSIALDDHDYEGDADDFECVVCGEGYCHYLHHPGGFKSPWDN